MTSLLERGSFAEEREQRSRRPLGYTARSCCRSHPETKVPVTGNNALQGLHASHRLPLCGRVRMARSHRAKRHTNDRLCKLQRVCRKAAEGARGTGQTCQRASDS